MARHMPGRPGQASEAGPLRGDVAPRPLSGPDIPWSRRRFLAAGVAAVGAVLAGCASDVEAPAAESAPGPGPASAGPSAGPTASTAPTAAAAVFPRTVAHAAGSTELATRPERVAAVTDGAELAALLALGIVPVGFGQRNDPLTPWIAEAGGGAPDIPRYELASETNFEVLASWRPDLIVGQYGFVTEETIARYRAVAPTVATSFVGWRESLRQVGAAVGADARAAELIAEVEADIAATKARLGGTRPRLCWLFGDGTYLGRLNDRSPIGGLLGELGLPPLPAQVAAGEAIDEIPGERLGEALAGVDAVVVLDFAAPAGDADSALEALALYRNSAPVQAGKVIELSVEESNGAYFDSVLTVRRNLALIERVYGRLA